MVVGGSNVGGGAMVVGSGGLDVGDGCTTSGVVVVVDSPGSCFCPRTLAVLLSWSGATR